MSNSHSPLEEDEITPLLPSNDWKTLLPCISEPTIDAGTSQLIDFKHSFRRANSHGVNDSHVPVPVLAFELLVVLYHLTLPGDHDDMKARLSQMSLLLFGELVSAIRANDDFGRQARFGAFLVYKFKADPSAAKHLCSAHSFYYSMGASTNVTLVFSTGPFGSRRNSPGNSH